MKTSYESKGEKSKAKDKPHNEASQDSKHFNVES